MFGRRAQVEHFVEVGYVVCGCLTMCTAFSATNAVVVSRFRVLRVACVVSGLRLMLVRPPLVEPGLSGATCP